MAGAELERVVELLRSERTDEQFRLLGAGTLLAELRSAVSVVHSNGTVSRGANQRLMLSIQSLVAPLRELLDTLLHSRIRSERWHQVPAVLFRHRFSRSSTLRDLGLFLERFRSLASYVEEASTYSSIYESSSYGLGLPAPPSRDAFPVPATASMVGRSELLERMVSVLLADRTRSDGLLVMPIVGGPGVGKTALARALLRDERVKRKFGVPLAVPVTRKFFLETTLMLLISPEIAAKDESDYSPEALAIRIGRLLSVGDYLIVLDDVWSDKEGSWLEIAALMRSLPWNGAVVVTTRTRDVAAKLAGTITEASCTNKPFYLQPLEPEFSCSFVDEWTAAYCGDWPGELFREAGNKIADRCSGVPLLLHYAGARFCQPQGYNFWQGFLGSTTDSSVRHPGIYFWREVLGCIDELPHDRFWQQFLGHSGDLPDGNTVLESAAAGYQHLPSDMRSCLLYCSMFPSGYDYDVEELSDLLAAQGYIPPVVAKAQHKGFLQQLLDECFYPLQEHEYGDKCFYGMHKVLHIFAQFMDRKTSSIVRADQATQLATKAGSQSLTSLRRASLIVNPLTASFPASLFKCQELGALILIQEGAMCTPDQPRCEISEIPQEFLQSCLRVQVLNFRGTKIRTFPTKFVETYSMRYLNLSLTDIDNIPSSIASRTLKAVATLSNCLRT